MLKNLFFLFMFVTFGQTLFANGVDVVPINNPKYPGFMYKPKGASGPLPGILLLHGSEGWGDYWKGFPYGNAKGTVTGEDAVVPQLAKQLASYGYVTYALSYFDSRMPGYGNINVPHELAFVDLQYTYTAMKWFKDQHVGNQKLVLWGFSRGAEQSLLLASLMMNPALVPDAERLIPDLVIAMSPSHMVQRGISDTLSASVYGSADIKHRFDMLPAWRWGETKHEQASPGTTVFDTASRTYSAGYQFNFTAFPSKILVTHFDEDISWGPIDSNLSSLIAAQPASDTLDLRVTPADHASGNFQPVLSQIQNSTSKRIFVDYPDKDHGWNKQYQIDLLDSWIRYEFGLAPSSVSAK